MPKSVPIPLSLMICDQVVVDSASGKTTIFGAFENILCASFPTALPRLMLFAELTCGHGPTPITIKFVRTTPDSVDGAVVEKWDLELPFSDPRAIARLGITIENIALAQAGEHRFILETEGALIIERRVLVLPKN
ncbi:MAG: hypothetical protein IPH13_11890 [Planctomycetes bacterium]|nr:hypothetical protein [Planctomycetota bacterium]